MGVGGGTRNVQRAPIYIYIHTYDILKIKGEKARSLFCKLQSNLCVFFFFFRKILQESRNFSLPLQHVEDIDIRESCTSSFLTLLDRSWTEPNLPNYRSLTWSQQPKHLSQHLGHTTLGTTTPLGVPKHSVQGRGRVLKRHPRPIGVSWVWTMGSCGDDI